MADSDALRMTASTVDKSSSVWKAIAKEIQQVANAGRMAQSAIAGFTGGLASGAVQQLSRDFNNLTAAIKNLGTAAVEMKFLMDETRLSQQEVLRFTYAGERLGLTAGQSESALRSLTGRIIDLRKLGLSETYTELLKYQGGPELAEILRKKAQAGDYAGAIRTVIDRMRNARGGADARREIARIFGIPERLADMNLDKLPQIIERNIREGEEFHKKLVDLDWTLGNVGTTLGNTVMPVLGELAKQFDEYLKSPMMKGVVEDVVRNLGAAIRAFPWKDFGRGLVAVGEGFISMGKGAFEALKVVARIPPDLRAALIGSAAGAYVGGRIAGPRGALIGGAVGGAAGLITGSLSRSRDIKFLLDHAELSKKHAQEELQVLKEQLTKSQRGTERYRQTNRHIEDTTRQLDKLSKTIEELKKQQQQGGVSPISYGFGAGRGGGIGGGIGAGRGYGGGITGGGQGYRGGGRVGRDGGGGQGGPAGTPRPEGFGKGGPVYEPVTGTGLGGGVGGTSASMGAGRHQGDDIMAPHGSPVYAAKDGVIDHIGRDNQGGTVIVVRHSDGSYSRYMHMSKVGVKPGDPVTGGQEIGKSGTANGVPHLHFEMWNGRPNARGSRVLSPREIYGWGKGNMPQGGREVGGQQSKQPSPPSQGSQGPFPTTGTISGTASTYDPTAEYPSADSGGRRTASGEMYDPDDYTAAIQTDLRGQFGGVGYGKNYRPAYALVESPDGKRAIVRINDVGPLKPGRIIDLNKKSMEYFDPGGKKGLIPGIKVTPLPGTDYKVGPVSEKTGTASPTATATSVSYRDSLLADESIGMNRLRDPFGLKGRALAKADAEGRQREATRRMYNWGMPEWDVRNATVWRGGNVVPMEEIGRLKSHPETDEALIRRLGIERGMSKGFAPGDPDAEYGPGGTRINLDRALGRESASPDPSARLKVNVDAPRGTTVDASGDGIFNETETSRTLRGFDAPVP